MAHSIGFIELDRRFQQLSPKPDPQKAALESYTSSLLGRDFGLGSSDLLKRRLVVVLGEPGSGKSQEFKEQARLRRAKGDYGFFVRLDQLVTQPLKDVLSAQDHDRYQAWQHGWNSAIFFLDSVDEAKFQNFLISTLLWIDFVTPLPLMLLQGLKSF